MNKTFSAVIVEKEDKDSKHLIKLISEELSGIKVLSALKDSCTAIRKIHQKHPDILFLDVELDKRNAFDIINELKRDNHLPSVVLVTKNRKYAVEAFKAGVIDYLIKPIQKEDLERVYSKLIFYHKKDIYKEYYFPKVTAEYYQKLRFNTRSGYILVAPDELIYCESDGNYSVLHLKKEIRKVICMNLNKLTEKLSMYRFKRISRYHIINEIFLNEVDRSKQECTLSCNNQTIKLKYSPKYMNGTSWGVGS